MTAKTSKILPLAAIIGLTASATLLATPVSAEENLWLYASGTDTRPKGSWELKLSGINRVGKHDSNYSFWDIRPEIEYGVTDKLTIGAEIFIFSHDYSTTNEDLQPYFDTQGGAGGRFNKTSIGGYELMMKYNFMSPYKDAFGFSMGLAFDHRGKYRLDGADINQNALEIVAYFQKNFLDDTLVFAFTPKIELENRTSGDSSEFVEEEEISLDIAIGVSYRFAPKWFIGLEFRHQSDYLSPIVNGEYDDPALRPSKFGLHGFKIGTQHQNGNYFGPTVHYAAEHWWATAGVLFQFSGGGSRHSFNVNGKNWDEHESAHIGLTFGYEF